MITRFSGARSRSVHRARSGRSEGKSKPRTAPVSSPRKNLKIVLDHIPNPWHNFGMQREPRIRISYCLPQRQIDAIDQAAGEYRSRSSLLAEVLDKAIRQGWLKPASAAKKGRA